MSALYLPELLLIDSRIILWRDVMRADLDYPTSSLGPLFICRQSIGLSYAMGLGWGDGKNS